MQQVTTILADESGIQYLGVRDKSAPFGYYPITGLIVGKFKRGRLDRPMNISKDNIRAQLGYEPLNPFYAAVQAALDSDVPSVQVLRIQGVAQVDHAYLTFADFSYDLTVKINGRAFVRGERDFDDFARELYDNGLGVYSTYDSLGCRTLQRFQNMTSQPLNIVIEKAVDYGFGIMILSPQENTTVRGSRTDQEYDWNEGVDTVQFSLAPDATLLDFSPDQVIFEQNNGHGFYAKNSANQAYRYQFILNDQVLMNTTTGNDYFTMTSRDEGLQALNAIGSAGVYGSFYINGNYIGMAFGVYSASDRFFKLQIRQLGNIDQNTKMQTNGGTVINDTPNEYTVEGYAYDPLDLERAPE